MLKLLEEGKVRAVGVSNFKASHIDRLLQATGVAPHVNQLQINPWIPRKAERDYDAAQGVLTESWAPIAQGSELLTEKVIVEAAHRHARTPAQIVFRWHVQSGCIPIPKTSNSQRLAENISVFDFALAAEEMDAISGLDRGGDGVVDSDRFGH
jgi:2,5-diketo-D-gluconate reductase A